MHTENFNSNECESPPRGREHVWKTTDPIEWYRKMFNRTLEKKTANGLVPDETEFVMKDSDADDVKSVLAEMIDRRIHAEEQTRLANVHDRAELQRITGADRNNNLFLRIQNRFGEYAYAVIRDELLEQMVRTFPEDYPNGNRTQPEGSNMNNEDVQF